MHKAWCSLEYILFYFSRSSILFLCHTGWKINDLETILVRLLGLSQLSNPSDLPCLLKNVNGKWYLQTVAWMLICVIDNIICSSCVLSLLAFHISFVRQARWCILTHAIKVSVPREYHQDKPWIITGGYLGRQGWVLWVFVIYKTAFLSIFFIKSISTIALDGKG